MANLDALTDDNYRDIVVLLQLQGADLITRAEFRKNLRKFYEIELDD